MKLYRTLLFILINSILPANAQPTVQPFPSPKQEIRAVWLATIGGIDWPHSRETEKQKEELITILDQLKRGGINTVLLQTRVRATTIYPSAYEPWDVCITGRTGLFGKPDARAQQGRIPSYNPLQFAIDECHKRGMQLHAWVVTIPVGKWNAQPTQLLRKKYPTLLKKIGDEGYMNPEQRETGEYLAKICDEIVSQYDVDGVHLDYIRYPETWPKAKKGVQQAERRNQITQIVNRIYKMVKIRKPWVIVSCSPIGKHDDLSRYRSGGWNARKAVSQDAQQWMKDGVMDALYPMMYFRDNNFFPFAMDWQENSNGRWVVPGLGIYFLDPKEGTWTLNDVQREMSVVRQLGMGHCYFRSKFFTDNTKSIYDFGANFDATPALIPPMTWCNTLPPSAPSELGIKNGVLSWQDAKNNADSPNLLYNVYASQDFPVDTDNPENLIATRIDATSIAVNDERLNYAVTAQDRYGLEGPATQLLLYAGTTIRPSLICKTDGKPIELPKIPSTFDAQYLVIESLQGVQLDARPIPHKTMHLDVSQLPNGIYQIRYLGKKGKHHRCGFFAIKRKKGN